MGGVLLVFFCSTNRDPKSTLTNKEIGVHES